MGGWVDWLANEGCVNGIGCISVMKVRIDACMNMDVRVLRFHSSSPLTGWTNNLSWQSGFLMRMCSDLPLTSIQTNADFHPAWSDEVTISGISRL